MQVLYGKTKGTALNPVRNDIPLSVILSHAPGKAGQNRFE